MITRESLEIKLAELQESQRILINNLNGHVGAIKMLEQLLQEVDTNEPVPDPARSPKVTKG